jgi:hypothetical protein
MKKTLASALVALVVLGGGAAASAQEDSAPPPHDGATATAPAHRGAHLRRRTVHGDLTVRTKEGFQRVAVDRGRLTSVDGATLTVARPDGPVVTFTIDDQTRFRGVESAEQLRTGKPVFVVSVAGVAKAVAQRK